MYAQNKQLVQLNIIIVQVLTLYALTRKESLPYQYILTYFTRLAALFSRLLISLIIYNVNASSMKNYRFYLTIALAHWRSL